MPYIAKLSNSGGVKSLNRYVSVLAGNPPFAPLPEGRVAYYPGTITSGSLINTLGTNGTTTNVTQVAGNKGNGASFNGSSSFVNLNFNSNPSALTFAFWIKAAQPAAQGQIVNNVAYFADATTNFPFQIVTNTSGTIQVLLSSGNDYVTDASIVTPTSVLNNTWRFVAVTYTANSSVKLYVDGALSASTTLSFAVSTSAYNWFLGRDAYPYSGGEPGRFLNGILDEISYYTRELSLAEVQALMAQDGS
jgi:hypothetical protein